MATPSSKEQFIEQVRASREAWEQALLPLDDHTLQQPGFSGEWSGKDVIAHITWHEKEMIGLIEAHALVGSDLWDLPLDERNAAIYAENRDRALEEVRQEADQVYAQLLDQLSTLTEEDLHDPARFPDMPSDWQPWKLIAGNTYEHYDDHLPQALAFHAQ
jgi:uncharacterized damage-inducible protein DinB